ncbi:MAG: trypsin-like peptidase domain-containing protein, partial [Actinobacteria bacterium]|nr:trypsin-like peptidase domain-containing protein [Actinomycetota bacterium]
AVWGGYRLGLVIGGTSSVFLVQGLLVASLLTPALLAVVGDPALRLILGLALFVAAGIGGQRAGRRVGVAYQRALVSEDLHRPDRLAGAVAGPVTVLAVVWLIVLPAMHDVAGWPGNLAARSGLGRAIRTALPEPPEGSHALRKLTRPVAMPEVLTALGPAGDMSPPPRKTNLSPEVIAKVKASTVRVQGEACLFDRFGTGFAVADDLVVTNAHVVAGERETTVVRPDGSELPAVVAVFDPERDLALLRVPDLGQEPLPLGPAKEGTLAAVFGHPEGQEELEVSPAAIRQQLVATVRSVDLDMPTLRSVFVLAADLQPGDSGAALVTPSGTVAGVAFAVARDRAGVAYALTTEELEPVLELDRSGVADTGPC